MNKQELRILLKAKLKEEEKSFAKRNESLSKNLKVLISELNTMFIGQMSAPIKLGGFMPMHGEPFWQTEFSQTDEIDFCLVHTHEEIKLTYHEARLTGIKNGEYGLKLDENTLVENTTPDIVLVPGLGFTKSLERLGRGKAYFDSFLTGFEGISIGLFYSFQEVETVLSEAHDMKLNFIVTDKEIIRGI